ncbi:solute carrier family 22 member 6-B-like [Babylonia areolata]|uniref:solute carrier family 22 member 6-B-like n=1 Tax=Babylonia areolata TaxID=304850 RepID=UPI003FD60A22
MKENGNIDPTLRALGGRARYQMLQIIVINVGCFGAAYQLLDNIFIGRAVEGQRCAAPTNTTSSPQQLGDLDWHSANITYGKCSITVANANGSGEPVDHPCLFGYQYGYRKELSFRTEFDLVCGHKLLGGLVQTFVILGQGVGAVLSSIISDRLGRKPTLVGSQLGLFVVGTIIGFSPSYTILSILKFLVGTFQQGVVGTMAAMCIELFPMEHRSLQPLIFSVIWGMGASSMTLFAFTMRELGWRYLQFALSAMSLLTAAIQLWYVDESLRWLMANGKKEAAMRIMERASRVNGKKLTSVLQTLQDSETEALHCEPNSITPSST